MVMSGLHPCGRFAALVEMVGVVCGFTRAGMLALMVTTLRHTFAVKPKRLRGTG